MIGLLGISMGAVVGAGYAYYKKAQEQSSTILNENMGKTSPVMETAPSFQISREVFLYWCGPLDFLISITDKLLTCWLLICCKHGDVLAWIYRSCDWVQ